MIPPRRRDRSLGRSHSRTDRRSDFSPLPRKRPLSDPEDLPRPPRRPRYSPPEPRLSEYRNLLDRHSDILRFASFSAGGDYVVTCGKDRDVFVWHADARGNEPLNSFEKLTHEGMVFQAHVTNSARQVITSCYDGSVRIWELGSNFKPTFSEINRIATLPVHRRFRSARACQITPDGSYAVATFYRGTRNFKNKLRGACMSSFASTIILVDKYHDVVFEVEESGKADICKMSNDGAILALGFSGVYPKPQMATGNSIVLMNNRGREIARFRDCLHNEPLCTKWDLSDTGAELALVSDDQQAIEVYQSGMWDQRPIVLSSPDTNPYQSVRFADHGRLIIAVVGSYRRKTIRVFNVRTRAILFELPEALDNVALAIEPRVRRLSTISCTYDEVRTISKSNVESTFAVMCTSQYDIRTPPRPHATPSAPTIPARPSSNQDPYCGPGNWSTEQTGSPYHMSAPDRRKPDLEDDAFRTPERGLRTRELLGNKQQDLGVLLERGRRKRMSRSPTPRKHRLAADHISRRPIDQDMAPRDRMPGASDCARVVPEWSVSNSFKPFDDDANKLKPITTTTSTPSESGNLNHEVLPSSKQTSSSRIPVEAVVRNSATQENTRLGHAAKPMEAPRKKSNAKVASPAVARATEACNQEQCAPPVNPSSGERKRAVTTMPEVNRSDSGPVHPGVTTGHQLDLRRSESCQKESTHLEAKSSEARRVVPGENESRIDESAEEEPNRMVCDPIVAPVSNAVVDEPMNVEKRQSARDRSEPEHVTTPATTTTTGSGPAQSRNALSCILNPEPARQGHTDERTLEGRLSQSTGRDGNALESSSRKNKLAQHMIAEQVPVAPAVGCDSNQVSIVNPILGGNESPRTTACAAHVCVRREFEPNSATNKTNDSDESTPVDPNSLALGQAWPDEGPAVACPSDGARSPDQLAGSKLRMNEIRLASAEPCMSRSPTTNASQVEPSEQARSPIPPINACQNLLESIRAGQKSVEISAEHPSAVEYIPKLVVQAQVPGNGAVPSLNLHPSPVLSTRRPREEFLGADEPTRMEVADAPAARTRLATRKISFKSTRKSTRSAVPISPSPPELLKDCASAPETNAFDREGSSEDNIPIAQLRRTDVSKRKKQTRTKRHRASASIPTARSQATASDEDSGISPPASSPREILAQSDSQPAMNLSCPNIAPTSPTTVSGPLAGKSVGDMPERPRQDVTKPAEVAEEMVFTSSVSSPTSPNMAHRSCLGELNIGSDRLVLDVSRTVEAVEGQVVCSVSGLTSPKMGNGSHLRESTVSTPESLVANLSKTTESVGEQLMLVGTSLLSSSSAVPATVQTTHAEEEECIDGGCTGVVENARPATVKDETEPVLVLPPPTITSQSVPVPAPAPPLHRFTEEPMASHPPRKDQGAAKAEDETVDSASTRSEAVLQGVEVQARSFFEKASDRVTASGMRCLTGTKAYRVMVQLLQSELGWKADIRDVARMVYGKTGTGNVCTEHMFLHAFCELFYLIQMERRRRWEKLFTEALPENDEALLVFHARDLLKQDTEGMDCGFRPDWTDDEMDDVFEAEGSDMLVNMEAFVRASERIVLGKREQ